MSENTVKNVVLVPGYLEVELVETKNGFEYYSVWDAMTGWVEDLYVRVPVGATNMQIEDAFNRNDTVSSF